MKRIARSATVISLAACGVLAHVAKATAGDCASLAQLALPHVTITLAEPVAAGAFKPPAGGMVGAPGGPSVNYSKLPAFCRVAATSRPTADSDIRFEVWLPLANWNGKYVGGGNGVWAGSIAYGDMAGPLAANYATAASDLGHQGSPMDGSFPKGHPEKLTDFGHRAVHETTVAAKAIVQAFYDKAPSRSLYVSCSTGGRVGLMEAYRYPQDFDGISAMTPANPMVDLLIGTLWTGYVAEKDDASRLPPAKLQLVHSAVLAACDADDGVRDGIVSAPQRCGFDPASLTCKTDDAPDCLTAAQVTAMQRIYDGPRNPKSGKPIYPGFSRGSENQVALLVNGREPFPVATSFFRDLVFQDPQWDFRSFDYGKDVKRSRKVASNDLDVPPKGPRDFLAHGGKLLLSHGWADGLIAPQGTVDFYARLTHSLGKRERGNVRLFMIPGMGHCGGGDGPSSVDMLTVIDNWVQTGNAPERIIASNPPNAATPRTRPLCPYPQEAKYTGAGSTDEERNFRCALP
ncbi:MAG TPA: tannase/feruloyl esterase family alpha/beta hydrolase [Steroidobacteraceae bacterium]|nr:tannase/feruloyl esterase family alpha/beta hydrolase [Steroidobacteraceae bacterium]